MAAGGLFICGTERHESRRIDNQLRGRSGRQGDPGETRFFLSAEDDLVRLFAGDRIYRILDKLGGVDEEGNEEPIEAGMLSKQIEKAQKKVEEQNFLIRKRVLEYDDVMNEQRRVIYAYRDEVLEGKPIGEEARQRGRERDRAHDRPVHAGRLHGGLGPRRRCSRRSGSSSRSTSTTRTSTPRRSTGSSLTDRVTELAIERYDAREAELGEELMGALERFLLLQIIDERWREHLFDMDYLREGIHLRGFAQIDPLVAYKNEAFTLFGDLMNSVWADFARMIFNVAGERRGRRTAAAAHRVPAFAAAGSSDARGPRLLLGRAQRDGRGRDRGGRRGGAGAAAARRAYAEDGGEEQALPVVEQRVVDDEHQVGRNDPCWCGSRQEVQEVPRRLDDAPSAPTRVRRPQRLAAIREQLKLLADYL